jgi:hypothetical protein
MQNLKFSRQCLQRVPPSEIWRCGGRLSTDVNYRTATLLFANRFFLPWRWKRHVPPKCQLSQNLHGTKSQKTKLLTKSFSTMKDSTHNKSWGQLRQGNNYIVGIFMSLHKIVISKSSPPSSPPPPSTSAYLQAGSTINSLPHEINSQESVARRPSTVFQPLTYGKHHDKSKVKLIATGYELDDRGVGIRVRGGSIMFTSPYYPDQLWGPRSPLFDGHWGWGVTSTTHLQLEPTTLKHESIYSEDTKT